MLDIAAGNGILSELAAAAGTQRLVLLDSSEPSLRLAAERLGSVARTVELVRDDVFAWDAGGERFDTIVFSSWFHHVPRRELGRFWHTVHALLRPGGQVMFDFPTAETAVTASPRDLPSEPTEEYSLYAPVEGVSIRDHRGRRWRVVHELWSRDDLVRDLDERGWTVTDSVPGWWQQFEWLRLERG